MGTKNINAVSQEGERYSIKSTTSNITGAIYGLEPPNSTVIDKPLFEYMVICKLDSDCSLEGIYQLSWDSFLKHKKWHSRINAWNVTVTSAMKMIRSLFMKEQMQLYPMMIPRNYLIVSRLMMKRM